MACCLTLALLFGLVRKLMPARSEAAAFAPPAYRSGLGDDAVAGGAARSDDLAPSSLSLSNRRLLSVGVAAGAFAYLVDVLVLTALGTLSAAVVAHAMLAVVAGAIVALSWPPKGSRFRPTDGPLVLGVAGLAFGALGLFEMHVLGTTSFVSPSLTADLAFHLAGPLLASCAALVLLSFGAATRVAER